MVDRNIDDWLDCQPGGQICYLSQWKILYYNQMLQILPALYVTCWIMCAKLLSCVRLCVTLWNAARQASLSIGFPRQEHWSGLPCPHPGDLPEPGIEPKSLVPPALADKSFTISATWEAPTELKG